MKSSGQSQKPHRQKSSSYTVIDLKQLKDEKFLVLDIKYELEIIST